MILRMHYLFDKFGFGFQPRSNACCNTLNSSQLRFLAIERAYRFSDVAMLLHMFASVAVLSLVILMTGSKPMIYVENPHILSEYVLSIQLPFLWWQ